MSDQTKPAAASPRERALEGALRPFLRCVLPDGSGVYLSQVEALTNGDLMRLAEVWRARAALAAPPSKAEPRPTLARTPLETFPGDSEYPPGSLHTHHCLARMKWGDGECECGGKGPGEPPANAIPPPSEAHPCALCVRYAGDGKCLLFRTVDGRPRAVSFRCNAFERASAPANATPPPARAPCGRCLACLTSNEEACERAAPLPGKDGAPANATRPPPEKEPR